MTENDKLEVLRALVEANVDRIRTLGEWPDWIQPSTLLNRVPLSNQLASGFDAGIACALDLIPRNKQHLSAKLHAHYTPETVEQVRGELAFLKDGYDEDLLTQKIFDLEAIWWLAACSLCHEGSGVSSHEFIQQVLYFKHIAEDANSYLRFCKAATEWKRMRDSFVIVDGIALALHDGGMQAAYINGYDLAIQPMHGIWFVGTYKESLGIPEDFKWGTEISDAGPLSGPVHGSKQFVKCATFDELNNVLHHVKLTNRR